MKFDFFKAKLRTGGKTIEQIKNEFASFGEPLSDEEAEKWVAVNDLIDGMEVVVMESFDKENFYLVAYDDADESKIRDFIYQAEQDDYFGSYIDMREEFLNDWNSNNYEPNGSLSFSPEVIHSIVLKRHFYNTNSKKSFFFKLTRIIALV